ncbi:PAS domain S-box protein [Methanospirillum hungatei]|uniref:hybrid sensor histidine kinase/response regulator n=1 Tax=Methanospirillum hungatei TaxID=2203 RepID=UPI0026EC5BC8|nr:PAS domain S-box protein [Methanospirillum hungatei]MCA1915248.1 PAS domain S-box protein [Methanospirillum hungatei]
MIHILYVDDEELLLDLAKLFLERSGEFVVDTSITAVDLAESPSIRSYDAIISDYLMPDMDGIEFLKKIREKFPEMPFILFTGRGREEVVIEAINNGADFYLQKGGDPKAQFAELSHKVMQAVKRRQAEKELLESEQRFSKAFHANPAIAGLSDLATGTYVDVNDAFLERLSYKRDEVIGKTSLELNILTPEKRKELIHELETRGHLHNYETEIRTHTGKILHVLVSGDVILSGEDKLLLVQAVDITDRITSEEALRESEYRLRSFIENTADAVILIDEEGEIIEWNPAAEKISGIVKDDASGMKVWDIMFRMMLPERKTRKHLEEMEARIKESLKTGVPASQQPVITEILGHDGLPRYIRQVTFPIQTSKGYRFGIIIEDITREKITEEQAEITLNNLQRSQSIAHVGNWTLDIATKRFSASEEALALFGYPPDATPSFDEIALMIHPEDRPRIRDIFANALSTGKSYNIEMRIILPQTGEQRYLYSFGEVETDEEGRPVRVFGVNQDITELKKTSNALKEQESQFRHIIDNLPISISIVTPDGTIRYANPEAMALFEFSSMDELYNTKAPDVWADPSRRKLWLETLQKNGIVTNFEMDLKTPSGKKFWAIGFGIFITYKGELCILSAHHDITDRKRAEDELKKREEQYRFITENSIDVIWTMDLSGRFTYISPSVWHLRGYTPQEVMESTLEETISPSSIDKVQKILQDAQMLIKQGLAVPQQTFEVEQPCKDGSSVWTEVIARPLYDKWGDPIGFIGVSRDITKRREAEETLRDNEIKFISIFNQTPDPILIIDCSGKILEVNHGFHDMFGLSDDEVLGKQIDAIPALSAVGGSDILKDLMERGDEVYRKEMILTNRMNTQIIAEVAWSRLLIHGQPCLLIQIHDISEIRKAHDAAQKANNKLNILSSITRHDILNRVMIASLYSDEIKESVSDPTILKYLNTISQASADIEHLIRFTKEYQDLGTAAPAWQKIESVFSQQGIINLAKGIRIESNLDKLEIYADLMLERVLYNLVENSVRHGQNLTHITVAYEIHDTDCILTYEDDGGGVPVEEKEKIFERGFGKNTGMGLFLIREILSITGIEIHETGIYGSGVRFEIRVPSGKWRQE